MTTTAQPTSLADVRAGDVEVRRRRGQPASCWSPDWLDQHLVDPRTSEDVAFCDYGDGELLLAGDGAPARQ